PPGGSGGGGARRHRLLPQGAPARAGARRREGRGMSARKKNPLTTAAPENALTPQEIDERLVSTVQGRLATVRKDGGVHLSPIWFVWKVDEQRLYMVFGADRLHLRNFRADPRCTFMVDEDYRGEKQDIRAGAWAIVMRGRAELTEDAAAIEFVLKGI